MSNHQDTDPFSGDNREKVRFRYPSLTADSRYESEEAYTYLWEQKQKPYIKPQIYEKWKKRSFKQDISKQKNMGYNLNKLYAKIQNERTGSHLFPVKETA